MSDLEQTAGRRAATPLAFLLLPRTPSLQLPAFRDSGGAWKMPLQRTWCNAVQRRAVAVPHFSFSNSPSEARALARLRVALDTAAWAAAV